MASGTSASLHVADSARGHSTALSAVLHLAQRPEALEVGAILEAACRVVENEVAHLPLEASSVEIDRPQGRAERADHGVDRPLVELDARDLGEDRQLPGLVAVAGPRAPSLAGRGVQPAVTAIGEGAIAPQPTAAGAGEEAAQQIGAAGLARSPTLHLGAAHVLNPGPQLVWGRSSGCSGPAWPIGFALLPALAGLIIDSRRRATSRIPASPHPAPPGSHHRACGWPGWRTI